MVKYKVTLTETERDELLRIIHKGSHSTQTYRNAYKLLNCDQGDYSDKITNAEIVRVLKVGMRTIDRIKRRFVEEGFDSCLGRKASTRTYEKKMDGDAEAHLIAISCNEPPKGFSKWSLRMLADKMVELEYVESLSHETVRRVLKKRNKALAG